VRVNHRGLHILVPQQFLHGADVITILKQVRGKAVAKGVAAYPFLDSGEANGLF
jgi:hypothetical protein